RRASGSKRPMPGIQITPGTGSFYCGTCLRDNALVAELRRQGHDALMVPLYLPLTVDEAPTTGATPLLHGGGADDPRRAPALLWRRQRLPPAESGALPEQPQVAGPAVRRAAGPE